MVNKVKKIIIVGAVAAGSKCAFKLKREKPEYDITIFTEENLVSYSACGLPFFIGGQIKSSENLIYSFHTFSKKLKSIFRH